MLGDSFRRADSCSTTSPRSVQDPELRYPPGRNHNPPKYERRLQKPHPGNHRQKAHHHSSPYSQHFKKDGEVCRYWQHCSSAQSEYRCARVGRCAFLPPGLHTSFSLLLPADPWQVALNDMHTFEGVSAALDDIAGVLGSCTFYERIYDSELESAKAVFEQLPRLYAHCLRFMAKAIDYFQTTTASELSPR